MNRNCTVTFPVSKSVVKLLEQIQREAEAATMEALIAKAGMVVLPPAENPKWTPTMNGGLSMSSKNGVRISCHIYHEPHRGCSIPYWLASEEREDGNGNSWVRALGKHIVDDFGNLVPLKGGAQ